MYDFHIHTHNSHDSMQTLDEICESAMAKGLMGIAITDHADICFYDNDNIEERILLCIKEVNSAKEKYLGKLEIFQGIEIAEYLFAADKAEKILQITDYDVVSGSVHSVFVDDWTDSYSRLDFGKTVSDEKIRGFIHEYFSKVYEMANKTDFDVLCHLTCPLRYINGKYGRNVDSMEFKPEIEDILKLIIKRNISLEINTSGVGSNYNCTMPDSRIINLYRDLGGKMITLGSDAHTPEKISNGFDLTVSELIKIGFKEYFTYKNRKPVIHKFTGGI